jgi:hypothetical protein
MKQRIQFCTAHDGTRIAFAKAGDGPPLVRTANWFTHLELDWDSAIWRHWFEVLAEGRTLIRYARAGRACLTVTWMILALTHGSAISKRWSAAVKPAEGALEFENCGPETSA